MKILQKYFWYLLFVLLCFLLLSGCKATNKRGFAKLENCNDVTLSMHELKRVSWKKGNLLVIEAQHKICRYFAPYLVTEEVAFPYSIIESDTVIYTDTASHIFFKLPSAVKKELETHLNESNITFKFLGFHHLQNSQR